MLRVHLLYSSYLIKYFLAKKVFYLMHRLIYLRTGKKVSVIGGMLLSMNIFSEILPSNQG